MCVFTSSCVLLYRCLNGAQVGSVGVFQNIPHPPYTIYLIGPSIHPTHRYLMASPILRNIVRDGSNSNLTPILDGRIHPLYARAILSRPVHTPYTAILDDHLYHPANVTSESRERRGKVGPSKGIMGIKTKVLLGRIGYSCAVREF